MSAWPEHLLLQSSLGRLFSGGPKLDVLSSHGLLRPTDSLQERAMKLRVRVSAILDGLESYALDYLIFGYTL